MSPTPALAPILLAQPPQSALDDASNISASLTHLLVALAAACAVLSGALLAIGRLGARLNRGRRPDDAAAGTERLRERALPWASTCCYIGAGLLLLTAGLLIAGTHTLE